VKDEATDPLSPASVDAIVDVSAEGTEAGQLVGDGSSGSPEVPAPSSQDGIPPSRAADGKVREAKGGGPAAEASSKRGRRRGIWEAVGSLVLGFLVFFFTPLGDLAKGPVLGALGPVVRSITDAFSGQLNIPGVSLSQVQAFSDSRAVINDEIFNGDVAPVNGCFGGDWVQQHGGIPVFNEALTHLTTSRNDVILIDANFRYTTSVRTGKSVVECDEGGDGAVTIISYTVQGKLPSVRNVIGPGASSDGTRLSLTLSPGVDYPIAVTVVSGDERIVSWTADLVFMVGNERKTVQFASGKVAGSKGLPVFAAEEGSWKQR
jgi:hypothetical protein